MTFLEVDVQDSDHICHDLMDDVTAVEDGSADLREFEGNAHSVTISANEIVIICRDRSDNAEYRASLKHFREIIEDWEAFILDDRTPE